MLFRSRCVPPDDERSNYLLVKRKLLDRIEPQPAEVHRIRGELGLALLGCPTPAHVTRAHVTA